MRSSSPGGRSSSTSRSAVPSSFAATPQIECLSSTSPAPRAPCGRPDHLTRRRHHSSLDLGLVTGREDRAATPRGLPVATWRRHSEEVKLAGRRSPLTGAREVELGPCQHRAAGRPCGPPAPLLCPLGAGSRCRVGLAINHGRGSGGRAAKSSTPRRPELTLSHDEEADS
jgi:hypothetical protein